MHVHYGCKCKIMEMSGCVALGSSFRIAYIYRVLQGVFYITLPWRGLVNELRYNDSQRAWRWNPGGARFSVPLPTGTEAHPVACRMDTGSFPGGKAAVACWQHTPSSTQVKERVELYVYTPLAPHIRAFMACSGVNFTLSYILPPVLTIVLDFPHIMYYVFCKFSRMNSGFFLNSLRRVVGHSVVELVCLHWGKNCIFRCSLYDLWLQRLKQSNCCFCVHFIRAQSFNFTKLNPRLSWKIMHVHIRSADKRVWP
jgi:hypothetical protein